MAKSSVKRAVLALIAANIIWGAAPPIFKLTLEGVHPYTLAFLRFFLASLLMLPFVKDKLFIRPKDYFNVFFIGFFGISINILFFFLGLMYAPSINASIIGSAGPVFIILFALIFLREKPKNKIILGALLGLMGVLLILLTPLFSQKTQIASLGNIFLLVSTIGSVIYSIIAHNTVKKYNPMTITFWSFFIGALSFTPFFAQEVFQYGFLPQLTHQGAAGILFGAILSSFVAYYFHNWALKYLTAADVSVFVYIDPIVTLLVAKLLLNEQPDSIFVVGALLVFGGIFISEGRLHWHPLNRLFK